MAERLENPQARRERYHEAIIHAPDAVGAVIALADEEQANLRAENDRLRRAWNAMRSEAAALEVKLTKAQHG